MVALPRLAPFLASFAVAASALLGCASDAPSAPPTDGGTTATTTGSDTGTGGGSATGPSDAGVPAGRLVGTVQVPATFTGKVTRLLVAASSTLPLAGPPNGGVLLDDRAPNLAPRGSYALNVDATTLRGPYHVLVIVFMEGGGAFAPKAGTDYDAATATPLTFDGRSGVALGTLTLALHQTGDGH